MPVDLQALASKMRVLDGAWGTALHERGLAPGVPPEMWNTENAEVVAQLAEEYIQAGCDLLTANTFGTNRYVLAGHGRGERSAELAAAGVRLSRAAAGEVPVVASIGPTGRVMMMGDLPAADLTAAYGEVIRAVADAGADALVFESFSEMEELTLAVTAAKDACDLPMVLSMTFGCGASGTTTVMGNTPEQLAAFACEVGAAAVGANCGAGPDVALHITRHLQKASDLPIWIKPNAGLPQIRAGRTIYPMEPDTFAEYVPEFAAGGVSFFGGCCGTTPAHVRAVRAAVDAL